jgi:hypothetical protein
MGGWISRHGGGAELWWRLETDTGVGIFSLVRLLAPARAGEMLFPGFVCWLRVGTVGGWGRQTRTIHLLFFFSLPGGTRASDRGRRGDERQQATRLHEARPPSFFSFVRFAFVWTGAEPGLRAERSRAESQGIDARLDGPRAHRWYGTAGLDWSPSSPPDS